MNFEFLGIFATGLLICSSIPQVLKCYDQGHANGISEFMLWLWFCGMVCMGCYVLLTRGGDWVLFSNYAINIGMIMIILKYKYYPTKPANHKIYIRMKNMLNL